MAIADVPRFFYSQLFVTPAAPTASLAGKTVCVTGANVGLGKEAVRHFVRLGASKVVLACRNATAGEQAKQDIETSEHSKGVVEVWNLDLLDYDSVKSFARRLGSLDRLDIVILNAAIATEVFALDKNGNERTITTNVISTFLLAHLILPAMASTAKTHSTQPTMSIVSSDVHGWSNLPERAHLPSNPSNVTTNTPLFDALSDPQIADMQDRYPASKLLGIFALRSLCAEHPVSRTGVVINSPNPGLCHSELSRGIDGAKAWVMWMMKGALARTTEMGSRTLVAAGLAGEETHGQFLSDCVITEPGAMVRGVATGAQGKFVQGEELRKIVWEELKVKLEEIQQGVTRIA